MAALEGLVRAFNRYVEGNSHIVAPLVTSCGEFVTRMFRVFGLVDPEVRIGGSANGVVDEESVLTPVVNILSEFRSKGGCGGDL